MTFDQLEENLPNGFHDAKIEKISLDYAKRTANILMQLLTGTPDSAVQDEYRRAILNIGDFCYCVIEPPDPTYPFMRSGAPINIAGYIEDPETFPLDLLRRVMPKGVTCYRFFVHDWNAFIHIAAGEIQFSWLES